MVSHVRFGARVHSPLIRCGEADVLYAAERLEALRYAHYLKRGGIVVMDDRAIHPIRMPDAADVPYPEGVPEFLRGKGHDVLVLATVPEAEALGDRRCANIVLLGALATRLDLREEAWDSALRERIPEKILDLNLRAFETGRRLAHATQPVIEKEEHR